MGGLCRQRRVRVPSLLLYHVYAKQGRRRWCVSSLFPSRGEMGGEVGKIVSLAIKVFCGGLNHRGICLLYTWAHLHVTPMQDVKGKRERRFTAYIRTAVCIGVRGTLFWVCYGGRNWRIQERNPPEGLTAARFSFLLFLFCFCSGSYSSPPPLFFINLLGSVFTIIFFTYFSSYFTIESTLFSHQPP